MTVSYEWVVEEMEPNGDILDTCGFEKLEDAVQLAQRCETRVVIALRRDVIDEVGELGDRAYAYTREGELFGEFGAMRKDLLKRLARLPRMFWISREEAVEIWETV